MAGVNDALSPRAGAAIAIRGDAVPRTRAGRSGACCRRWRWRRRGTHVARAFDIPHYGSARDDRLGPERRWQQATCGTDPSSPSTRLMGRRPGSSPARSLSPARYCGGVAPSQSCTFRPTPVFAALACAGRPQVAGCASPASATSRSQLAPSAIAAGRGPAPVTRAARG